MNLHRIINVTAISASLALIVCTTILLTTCTAIAFYDAMNFTDESQVRALVLTGVSSAAALVLAGIAFVQANKILKLKTAITALYVEKAIIASSVKR